MSARTRNNRRGFTLLEIVIAMTVIALLAGAITPLVFKELQRAKEEATLTELARIKNGLEEFFTDTGRFPSEAEGLNALINDPGVTGWAGPYVDGGDEDPLSEVAGDAFDSPYVYDLNPSTSPAGAADLIVASGGADLTVTCGQLGGLWDLTDEDDDLLVLVAAGSLNRDKTLVTQQRLEAIGEAVREYYRDNAAFPGTLSDLVDTYLDAGLDGNELKDAWNRSFLVTSDGGTPPTLTVTSRGPDQTDNHGGGDDLALEISSIPPGRRTTLDRLEVAQAVLNADPNLALSGDWNSDRSDLGLGSIFSNDGWDQPLRINADSRVIYSVGPDGDPSTLTDNLPKGVGP